MSVRPPGVTGEVVKKGKSQNNSTVKDLGPGSLAGNLTKDPELRFTPSGVAVAQMRVAVADRRKDDRTGQWTEAPTEYFTVQAWRGLAENCAEHLVKGCRIIAEGSWKSDHWTDKDGQDQERVYLAATEVGASLLFTGVRILEPERRPRS